MKTGSTKECVSLNQSILKLRLFTYFLLDKKIWWFLSAVLSKMTLPNKSSPKNENRNEFISHAWFIPIESNAI